MSWQSIPPVRRLVPDGRSTQQEGWLAIRRFFANRAVSLYSSGTQALQAVMADCLRRRPRVAANIVLPAYGCPDLVTACLGAGVVPRLVDIAPAGWGYDMPALGAAIDENTIAIVCVNFLGIGDAVQQIAGIARLYDLALIQDSAQHLPTSSCDWPGDYVTFSFGKGKPLNLLGGGLAIGLADPAYETEAPFAHRACGSVAAGVLFNTITHPKCYGIFSSLAGARVGQTTYGPPSSLSRPRSGLASQLGYSLNQYTQNPGYNSALYQPYLEAWTYRDIRVLQACDESAPFALPANPLRLALCAADADQAKKIVAELTHHKLGATQMYRVPLDEVAGIPNAVRMQGPFPNATKFAKRLFTLPTHRAITSEVAMRINSCIIRASTRR